MEAFTKISSRVVPLPLNDVDTDMLIPAQYLTSVSKGGYGENLFRRLRDEQDGFILNNPAVRDYKILVAGSNFGCGSSREHAVWALKEWGFKVVIASSFADIFKSNSGKNGLVLVELPESAMAEILKYEGEVEVNLESQEVVLPGEGRYDFEYDPFRKHCILNGFEDMDYILSKKAEIEEYQKKREEKLFYTTLEENR